MDIESHADVLPQLYARWASEFLSGAIPAETAATCSDCAMLPGERESARPAAAPFFNPETKCCTYLPVLPNFLVGRMLADVSPEFTRGRASLEARLSARVAVSSLGIGRDAAYDLLYVTRGRSLFGRARSMRCPHYLDEGGGQCGIWRHRAAVCATWFCKYVRGAVGQRFWQALHRLLSAVEGDLSMWCARQLGVDAGADRAGVAADEPRRVFGDWSGREREFFQECARLVEALGWRDVERICGPEVRALTTLTREAFDSLRSPATRPRLRVGAFRVIDPRRHSSIVEGYDGGDRIELPTRVLSALHHFEGSVSTAQALRKIRAETGLAIAPDLVRLLVDFEILVAADRHE
jgi:hypothetical protein